MESSRERFEEEICKKGDHSRRKLDALFSDLSPVDVNEMMGEWQLGYLFTEGTGSRWESFIRHCPIRLYGKRFMHKNRVQAWLFNVLGVKFGLPGTSAILESICYRDKCSTSMIYNYLPMIDHFRKVDESCVMGIMEVRGEVSTYFYLRR